MIVLGALNWVRMRRASFSPAGTGVRKKRDPPEHDWTVLESPTKATLDITSDQDEDDDDDEG